MNGYPDALKARDHLQLAEDFYQAFRDLPQRLPPQSLPRYFLLCHAIELALKAYLVFYGATPKELKQTGVRHNLANLLTRAINAGLSLGASAQADIKLLSEAHEKFWPRYPKEDSTPIFTIEQFEAPARELLDSVAAALFGGIPAAPPASPSTHP
jgi:hypothetical protein